MTSIASGSTRILPALAIVLLTVAATSPLHAQTTPIFSATLPKPNPPDSSLPPVNPPPPSPAPASPLSPEAATEERFRKLEQKYEAMERRHGEEYRALSEKYEGLRNRLGQEGGAPGRAIGIGASGRGAEGDGTGAPVRGAEGTSGRTSRSNAGPNARERSGIDAQGAEGRTFVREAPSSAKNKTPAKVQFDEGIEFSSNDDEFKLTFHDLTQAEYRGFPSQQQGTLKDQFFIPRQRYYFTGQATKNVEFYTVINRGYGALDLLDAFMTINVSQSLTNRTGDEAGGGAQGADGRTTADRSHGSDPRVRFRVGRMKTPYLYEYFSIAEGDLIAPERSIYAGNLAGNRQDGAMLLGDIFEDRAGYAMGIFNGPRRSFQDFNSDKDIFFSLNSRPFLKSTSYPMLKYLNIGGAVNGGFEDNPTQPTSFATANDQTTSSVAPTLSPTFLTFNNNVIEQGRRLQYAAHLAYFHKSFMLLAEYGGGTAGYGLKNQPHSTTQIPLEGWMVQASYFLTGEQLTRRVNVVRPLHDFGYKDGKFGFGAFEVHGRFSEMDLGRQIFSAGFADPNLWTNRASATDVGVNWYLNYYTKVYFDWQHAFYGNPITTGSSNRFMSATDLFWLRFQVFF